MKIRLIFFGILALALVIASYFSEYLCPYDPYLQDLGNAKAVPSAAHIFGTDRYGRDMLSRVIVEARPVFIPPYCWLHLLQCLVR